MSVERGAEWVGRMPQPLFKRGGGGGFFGGGDPVHQYLPRSLCVGLTIQATGLRGFIAQRPVDSRVGRHSGGGMHVEFFEARAKMLR